MTHVLYYDPFKPNQGQVHEVRQYYELKVVSDTLLCGSVIINLIRLLLMKNAYCLIYYFMCTTA